LIDSPENTGSTANSLLEPFGLRTRHHQAWQGKLTMIGDWPGVRVERAREIAGGQTLARLDKMPIAARARYGKGLVMAVGFGSLWNDTNMGQTWMTDPDDALLQRFDILFAVLRAAINDQPLSVPPPRKPVEKAGDDGKEK
jgi:hypothetical protein